MNEYMDLARRATPVVHQDLGKSVGSKLLVIKFLSWIERGIRPLAFVLPTRSHRLIFSKIANMKSHPTISL